MLSTILTILVQIAGATGEASTITSIINALIQLIPTLVQEYEPFSSVKKSPPHSPQVCCRYFEE